MSGADKVVAVCGATGKQGGAVVAALAKLGGFHVRALTRNPASAASTKLAEQPNVEVGSKRGRSSPAALHVHRRWCARLQPSCCLTPAQE